MSVGNVSLGIAGGYLRESLGLKWLMWPWARLGLFGHLVALSLPAFHMLHSTLFVSERCTVEIFSTISSSPAISMLVVV